MPEGVYTQPHMPTDYSPEQLQERLDYGSRRVTQPFTALDRAIFPPEGFVCVRCSARITDERCQTCGAHWLSALSGFVPFGPDLRG